MVWWPCCCLLPPRLTRIHGVRFPPRLSLHLLHKGRVVAVLALGAATHPTTAAAAVVVTVIVTAVIFGLGSSAPAIFRRLIRPDVTGALKARPVLVILFTPRRRPHRCIRVRRLGQHLQSRGVVAILLLLFPLQHALSRRKLTAFGFLVRREVRRRSTRRQPVIGGQVVVIVVVPQCIDVAGHVVLLVWGVGVVMGCVHVYLGVPAGVALMLNPPAFRSGDSALTRAAGRQLRPPPPPPYRGPPPLSPPPPSPSPSGPLPPAHPPLRAERPSSTHRPQEAQRG
mmetsp:Transcript_88209/g.251921  ORF Transcript_88209/g.251921 Transcript_88209/m.251921 type:complete len:283 (-) Transcript_88209:425-1273(-)